MQSRKGLVGDPHMSHFRQETRLGIKVSHTIRAVLLSHATLWHATHYRRQRLWKKALSLLYLSHRLLSSHTHSHTHKPGVSPIKCLSSKGWDLAHQHQSPKDHETVHSAVTFTMLTFLSRMFWRPERIWSEEHLLLYHGIQNFLHQWWYHQFPTMVPVTKYQLGVDQKQK